MPSSHRAALPPPITTTSGEDRDVGSSRYSSSAGPPSFSPITPTTMEQQKDDLIAELRQENKVLVATNWVLLSYIRTIVPDLELSHVGSTRELRWLTGGDTGRFCASPESNARYLDRELYLEHVLKEAEIERKVGANWQAEMDARYERGHVIERRGEQSGMVYRELVGLLDQFSEGAWAHDEGEALVAPPMAA